MPSRRAAPQNSAARFAASSHLPISGSGRSL
jgi:hypothetical protein